MSYFDSIYAAGLPHRAVAVYMYLKNRADAQGVCWPGIRTMAAELKLSCSTIRRALRDLEQTGWLEKSPRYRENGSSSSNCYQLR